MHVCPELIQRLKINFVPEQLSNNIIKTDTKLPIETIGVFTHFEKMT